MSAIITRGQDCIVVKGTPVNQIAKLDYNILTNEQYKIYAKQYLKDHIMEDLEREWEQYIANRVSLNTFFEELPVDLLVFDNEESRRLLLKYITSNLKYCFGFTGVDSDERQTAYYMHINRLNELRTRK